MEATTGIAYPKLRTHNISRVGGEKSRLNEQRNASTVAIVDAPILLGDVRESKSVVRDSLSNFPLKKVESGAWSKKKEFNDYASSQSPLRKLTQQAELSDITRKHQIAMHGHIGHVRNLTQPINFASSEQGQPNCFLPGWGLKNEALKQGPELQRVRALPTDQQ